MTLYTVSWKQLFVFAILVSIISSSLVGINNYFNQYRLLPEVFVAGEDGKCVKVVNYENGHAFTCNDVDVILRRYRKVNSAKNE